MNKKAFTLIELMTVIGIIAILAGLMLVGYNIFFSEANIGSSMRFDSSIHHSIGYALVGDWKMDDNAANSTVVDTSGNGNDGTFYSGGTEDNTADHSVDGANGRALEFDGVDDYIETDVTPQNLDKPFTISFWGNISSEIGSIGGIIETGSQTSGGKGFVFGTPPSMPPLAILGITDGGSGDVDLSIDISSITNSWHHFVGTFDGSRVTIYLDSEIKDTATDTFSGVQISDTWRIGDISSDGITYFEGQIDQARIYKTNLSTSAIEQEYSSGLQKLYKKGLISREEYIKRVVQK